MPFIPRGGPRGGKSSRVILVLKTQLVMFVCIYVYAT